MFFVDLWMKGVCSLLGKRTNISQQKTEVYYKIKSLTQKSLTQSFTQTKISFSLSPSLLLSPSLSLLYAAMSLICSHKQISPSRFLAPSPHTPGHTTHSLIQETLHTSIQSLRIREMIGGSWDLASHHIGDQSRFGR